MNWLDLTAVVFCAGVAWHLGFLWLNPARRRTKQEAEQTQAMLASLAARLESQSKSAERLRGQFDTMKTVFDQIQAVLTAHVGELAKQRKDHEEAFAACDKAFQAMQAQVFEQVNVLRAKVNAEVMNGERVPNTMGQPGRRIF
jgi:septal ring factor EnvC (AmiA/AmiB activator)